MSEVNELATELAKLIFDGKKTKQQILQEDPSVVSAALGEEIANNGTLWDKARKRAIRAIEDEERNNLGKQIITELKNTFTEIKVETTLVGDKPLLKVWPEGKPQLADEEN